MIRTRIAVARPAPPVRSLLLPEGVPERATPATPSAHLQHAFDDVRITGRRGELRKDGRLHVLLERHAPDDQPASLAHADPHERRSRRSAGRENRARGGGGTPRRLNGKQDEEGSTTKDIVETRERVAQSMM